MTEDAVILIFKNNIVFDEDVLWDVITCSLINSYISEELCASHLQDPRSVRILQCYVYLLSYSFFLYLCLYLEVLSSSLFKVYVNLALV